MERRGECSERGDLNRDIEARNAERRRLNGEADQVSAEIIDLAAERAKRAGAGAPPVDTNGPPDDEADEAAGQGRRGAKSQRKPEPARPRRSAEEVLAAITARQAAFTWRDLNWELGKEIADPTQRALATDELLRLPDIVGLRETMAAPVSHYTTRAVLDAERALLRATAALSGDTGHGVHAKRVERARAANGLNEEQAEALRHATGPSGFAIIAGEAGTGKSRALGAIREAYEADGFRVTGMSWTNSVVQDMRQDGFAQCEHDRFGNEAA